MLNCVIHDRLINRQTASRTGYPYSVSQKLCCQSPLDNEAFFSQRYIMTKAAPQLLRRGSKQ